MDKTAGSNHWFSGWRLSDRATALDPADVGTAFGLDLSMAPEPVSEVPPARPARAPSGWARRMRSLRRGSL